MILTLQETFSSAHLYNQPLWSPEQNRQQFERCFTPYGHGHNYKLQLGFEVNEETLLDLKIKYQNLIHSLCEKLDHEHLNFVIPEFKTQIPTTENIALYFQKKIQSQLADNSLRFIRLYEMDNLWTEIQL